MAAFKLMKFLFWLQLCVFSTKSLNLFVNCRFLRSIKWIENCPQQDFMMDAIYYYFFLDFEHH